jgi:hypothetical protein
MTRRTACRSNGSALFQISHTVVVLMFIFSLFCMCNPLQPLGLTRYAPPVLQVSRLIIYFVVVGLE